MSSPHQTPVVGALYASRGDDGRFRIMKILALDDFAVHLRIYAERFDEPPARISSAQLSLGVFGPGGYGIGHVPISAKGFGAGLTLVGLEEVHEEELDGYRIWAGQDPL